MGANGSKKGDAAADNAKAAEESSHLSSRAISEHALRGGAAPAVIFYRGERSPNLAAEMREEGNNNANAAYNNNNNTFANVHHNVGAATMMPKTKKADRWYMEDVTTTSHEPRKTRSKQRRMRRSDANDGNDDLLLKAGGSGRSAGAGEGGRGERGERKQTELSSGSQPPLCVNTPQNVALFMEKFEGDIKQLLPYCFNAQGEPEFSIALCFVSRLTMQDRAASQRLDCRFFPPFQHSQRAFYFRLIPVGEQSDHLFVVEYYSRADYNQPTLILNPHGWIQFEALLRLFFHQGYRYLMKLFPESFLCAARSVLPASACSALQPSNRFENQTQQYQEEERQGERREEEEEEEERGHMLSCSPSSESSRSHSLRSSTHAAFSVSIPIDDARGEDANAMNRTLYAEQSVW